MWISTVVVASLLSPLIAEATFKGMEKKMRDAKTLSLRYEFKTGDVVMKGRLVIVGNKFLSEFEFKKESDKMVSDGVHVYSNGKSRTATEFYGDVIRSSGTRWFIFYSFYLLGGGEPTKEWADRDNLFPVSGFKIGKKELIGGKEALSIEYTIGGKWKDEPSRVTVWIANGLPVKRVVQMPKGGEKIVLTETYAEIVIDGKVDDKLFVVPE